MKPDIYALEIFIARFLRFGVLLAGFLMLVGWLSHFSLATDTFEQFRVYHELRLLGALKGVIENRQWGLLISYAGMFVLICLPVLRVFMTFTVFVQKKDYLLAGISALVLFGLLLSVTLGFEI